MILHNHDDAEHDLEQAMFNQQEFEEEKLLEQQQQNQAFFDKTAIHLLTQMVRAMDNTSTCVYRGPHGYKCAAGVHIPDELYDPEMEGKTVQRLVHEFPNVAPYFPNLSLADALQSVHDVHRPDTWYEQLAFVGRQFALDINVLKPFDPK